MNRSYLRTDFLATLPQKTNILAIVLFDPHHLQIKYDYDTLVLVVVIEQLCDCHAPDRTEGHL